MSTPTTPPLLPSPPSTVSTIGLTPPNRSNDSALPSSSTFPSQHLITTHKSKLMQSLDDIWQGRAPSFSTAAPNSGTPNEPLKKFRSELLQKAAGPLLVLLVLVILWSLTLVFTTHLSHVAVGSFKVVIALQFLLWSVLRQGMSIVALLVFDIYYTTPDKHGHRRSMSLYTLDAWSSLFITPINLLRGKFLNVLLVLLPTAVAVFSTYATSSLLGRETSFLLLDTDRVEPVTIGPAGAGDSHRYLMTGQEFVYNASNGALHAPNSRFVWVLSENSILVPSIPDIGTYFRGTFIRGIRARNVQAVVAHIRAETSADKRIAPTEDEAYTTAPDIGDNYYEARKQAPGRSLVKVSAIMKSNKEHRQLYFNIFYSTVLANLTFATFNNGTHIQSVQGIRNVTAPMPGRLTGEKNLSMDSVLDNFLFSQNGRRLLKIQSPEDPALNNIGLVLAGAFAIRAGVNQSWLDGMGKRDVHILQEREVIVVPPRYWIVAAGATAVLALTCITMAIRRCTFNGNLVQLVALMSNFILTCQGSCTPKWQRAYVENASYEESFMNNQIFVGYSASETRDGRKIIETPTGDDRVLRSHHIALDSEERVTRDKLNVLYGLLAGTPYRRSRALLCNAKKQVLEEARSPVVRRVGKGKLS